MPWPGRRGRRSIPEIVGPKDMRSAITLNSVGMNVARAVGPAMGGALVAVTITSGPAFLINAASFLGVIAFLWRWKRRIRDSALPAERFVGAMRMGVRYVRYSPRFRATLVRIGAFILFASALATLLPVIARSYLHRGPGAYGVLLGFMGAGAVAAVPVLQHAQRVMKVDVLLAIATVISGCVELAHRRDPQLPHPLRRHALAGVAWVTVMSSMNNAAQSVLPAWVRARAMSVYLMVFFGSMTMGGIVWGIIATRVRRAAGDDHRRVRHVRDAGTDSPIPHGRSRKAGPHASLHLARADGRPRPAGRSRAGAGHG